MTQKNRHNSVPYTPMNRFDQQGFNNDLLKRVRNLSIADTKAHQQYLDYQKANDEFDAQRKRMEDNEHIPQSFRSKEIAKRLKEIRSLSDDVLLAYKERDKLRDVFWKHLRLNADLTLTMSVGG